MSKKELKNDWRRIVPGAALGAAAAIALSVLLLMLEAPLISGGRVGEGAENALIIVTAFIAAASGALVARIKNRGASLIGAIFVALMVIIVRLVIMLIADSAEAFDSLDIQICLSILCGALISGAISIKKRRRRR